MNFFKQVLFSILFFFSSIYLVSASNYPIFETKPAVSITENSAYLQGDFYFDNNGESFPLIWFQYGIDEQNLNQKTEDIIETKKDFVYSKKISFLTPDTKYFFRTVLEINENIFYGEILSFKTKPDNFDDTNNVSNLDYGSGDANYYLNKMIREYDESIKNSHERLEEKNNSKFDENYKPFTFFDFLNWFKRKDSNEQDNLVHTEEEIRQAQEDETKRMELLRSQERYNNSAYENDELGEIIRFNNGSSFSRTKNPVSLVLIFIVLLLVSVFMLIKMFYLKNKRFLSHRKNIFHIKKEIDIHKNNSGKYNIPMGNYKDKYPFDKGDK